MALIFFLRVDIKGAQIFAQRDQFCQGSSFGYDRVSWLKFLPLLSMLIMALQHGLLQRPFPYADHPSLPLPTTSRLLIRLTHPFVITL